MSEQVRKLEQELGVMLFNCSQRSVALSPAGTALLEEARHVLRHEVSRAPPRPRRRAEVASASARDYATRRIGRSSRRTGSSWMVAPASASSEARLDWKRGS
jgi:DNA-binding transcriptional LysR family regulator